VIGFAVPQTARASEQHSKQRVAGSEHEPVVLSFVSQTITLGEFGWSQNRMCVQPAFSDSISEDVASAALSVAVPSGAVNTSFELCPSSGLLAFPAQAPTASADRTAIAAHIRDFKRVSFPSIRMVTLLIDLVSTAPQYVANFSEVMLDPLALDCLVDVFLDVDGSVGAIWPIEELRMRRR
jgi:hypothetical protein